MKCYNCGATKSFEKVSGDIDVQDLVVSSSGDSPSHKCKCGSYAYNQKAAGAGRAMKPALRRRYTMSREQELVEALKYYLFISAQVAENIGGFWSDDQCVTFIRGGDQKARIILDKMVES